jgi:AraC-like DNA-binding protein
MSGPATEFISAGSVRALDAAARAIGIRLDVASLAPSLSVPGDAVLVPVAEQTAYCRALLSNESETLGLDLARNLPLHVTGLWGFLLRSSRTYGEMLRRAERYIRIVNKYPEFVASERGACTALASDHPTDSPFGNRPQAVMVTLAHWISWGRELTGVDFSAVQARFRWSGPKDRRPFDSFYRCRVEFGADEDVLVLDRETTRLPLRERAPELTSQFESMAALLIDEMTPQSADFLDRVRSAVCEELLVGSGEAAEVARRLAMSQRTLHRKLVQHGATFRRIKDSALRARAERLMQQGDVSLKEVCYLLGFSEPASFNRAFHRWTGMAPSTWRQTHRGRPEQLRL